MKDGEMVDSVKANKKNDKSKKNKKSRIAAILLATVWISYTDVAHGISSEYLKSIQTEQVFVQSQQAVVEQRLTLLKKISENIVMAGEGEKYTAAQQQLIASAILVSLLSSPTAQISFTGDNLNTNAQPLTTAIRTTLQSLQTSIPAGVGLTNVSSVIQSVQNSMSASLATTLKDSSGKAVNIKSDSTLTLTPTTTTSTNVSNAVVASSAPAITRLIYTGQDLSQAQYNKLETLEITVAQLNLEQVIQASKVLNVIVIGDALSQEINFDKLNFKINVLDLSNVTGLTKVNAFRSPHSIKIVTLSLPTSVTDLKIVQYTNVIVSGISGTNLSKLKNVILRSPGNTNGFESPAWLSEDSFFSDGAVLNLSKFNQLDTIGLNFPDLSGLSSKIKTVVFPTYTGSVKINDSINTIGILSAIDSIASSSLPAWIKNITSSNVSTLDLNYETTRSFNLNGLPSNFTNLSLSPLTYVENLPNTITHVSAYYPYLRDLDLNNTSITHLTLSNVGDVTVKNNFLCDLTKLQSFSAPFATIHIDGGTVSSVGLNFLCYCTKLEDVNILNIDFAGINGKTEDTGKRISLNLDSRPLSVIPGLDQDDDLMIQALDLVSVGNGRYVSQALAPILLLKTLWALKSNSVGPMFIIKPFLYLLAKKFPNFAAKLGSALSKLNAIQSAATGFSTLVSIGTFAQIVFEYGPESFFDSKKGRLRAYVSIKSGTEGQSIVCLSYLSALKTLTLNSVKIIGGTGGSAVTDLDTTDVGTAGLGGTIFFLQNTPNVESLNFKNPLNISAGKGGSGRNYKMLNLENSVSYEVVLLLNPFLAPYLVPMILLNRLFDVELPPIGRLLEPISLFIWSAPITLDMNYAASGSIFFLGNWPHNNLRTLTLSTTESDEFFNTLFNVGAISKLVLTGNTILGNTQKSLPKYLNGNNTATPGSATLDLTNVGELPTTLNLRTLNPKFATIILPDNSKYLARSNQTIQGGRPFSTTDYSIFLDNQDGEGLTDLRFLDGVVSSDYTLYAPLSISCYLGPVEFTMPIKNDNSSNANLIYRHSNGALYTRTIKRKTIVNDTIDLSDVGYTSSKTMRIDSLTGVKKVLLPEQIETVILPSTAEEITAHIRLRNVSGTNKLKKIKLTGDINYGEGPSTIILPGDIRLSLSGGAWPIEYLGDARLTAENATLDLSGIPNLPIELDLTMLNSNISKVILNPEILQGTRLDLGNTYMARLDHSGNALPYNENIQAVVNYAISNPTTKKRTVRKITDDGSGTPVSEGPLSTTTVIKAYTNLYFLEGIKSLKRLELIGSGARGFLPAGITSPEQIINTDGFLPNWIFDKTKTSDKGFTLDLSKVIDLSLLNFDYLEASHITDLILSENIPAIKISKQIIKTLTAYPNIQFQQDHNGKFGTARIQYLKLLGESTTLPTWLYKATPANTYLNEVFASGQTAEEQRTKLDISNLSKLPDTLDLRNIISMFNVVLMPLHIVEVSLAERIIEISSLSDYVETLTASVAAITNLAQYAVEDSTPHTESNRLNQRVHLSKIIITEGDLTTTIGDNFLRKVEGPVQIDFSNIVENITSVGANFLTDSTGVKICFPVNKTPSAAFCTALNNLSGQTLKLTGNTTTLPTWLTQNAKVPSVCTLDVTELGGLDPILNLKGLASDITKVRLTDPGYYCDVSATLSNEEALNYIITNTETIINQAPAQHKTTTRAIVSKISDLETKIAAGTVSGSTRRINLVPPVQTLQSAHYINTSGQTVEGGIQASIPTQTVSNGLLDLSAESSLSTHLDLTTKDATTVKLPSNTVAVILHENVTTLEFGDNLMHLSWNTTNTNVKNIRLINGTATTIPFIRNSAGVNLNMSSMTNLGSTIDIKSLKGTLSADVRKISLPSNTTTIKLTGSVSNLSDALSFVDDSAYGHLMLDLSSATGLQGTDFLLSLPKIAKEISLPSSVSNITLPVNFTELTAPSSLAGVTLAQGHPKLSKVNLTGSVTTLPNWVTNNSVTQTGFAFDVSQITYPNNSLLDISGTVAGSVAVPLGVSRIKASSSLQTIQLVGSHPGLTNIAITGTLTVPTWAKNDSLTAAMATLDLSAMTGTTVDLTGISADFTTVILPATVTNLTIPSTITTLNGVTALTTLKLTGATTTIPAWAVNGSLTAENATLDLSTMTGLGTTLNLVGINSEITTVVLPSDVTEIVAPDTLASVHFSNAQKTLTRIAVAGESISVPIWSRDGSLTTTGATLDLRLMMNLPTSYTVPDLDDSILYLMLPAQIESYTLDNANSALDVTIPALPVIILEEEYTSNTTLPSYLNNVSGYAELDLSNMTSLTLPLDLTSISSKILSVTLPTNVTSVRINASVNSLKLATGHAKLTNLILTGSTPTIPTWATDGSLTAENAALDLSALTSITSTLTLVALSSNIKTIKLPALVTNLTIPDTVTSASGVTALTKLKLTGAVENVPTFAKNGTLTATNATLDLSEMSGTTLDLAGLNADITAVTLSSTVRSLTIPSTGTTINGITNQLTTLALTGAATTIPAWATDGSLTAASATLGLLAMTGLPSTLSLVGISTDITKVTLPATVTNLTIPSRITDASGITDLTNIAIVGTLAAIPAWLKNPSFTAANAVLDLSTAIGTTVDLTGLSPDINQLIINAAMQPTGISNKLTTLKLTGTASSIPTWAKDGSLTATNATLDLSEMVGLSAPLSLTGLSTDIVTLVINGNYSITGITNHLSTLKVTGPGTSFTFVVGGEFLKANSTLDVSAMTGLPATIPNLVLGDNITTLILPENVTASAGAYVNHIVNLTGSFELINSLAQWDSVNNKNKLDNTDIRHLNVIGSGTKNVSGDLFKGCTKLESFTMNSGLTLKGVEGASGNFSAGRGNDVTLLTSCTALTAVDLSATTIQAGNGGNSTNGTGGAGGNLTLLTACTALGAINLSSATIQTSLGGYNNYGNGGRTRAAAGSIILFDTTTGSVRLTATSTTVLGTLNEGNKVIRIYLTGNVTTLPTWVNNASLTKDAGTTLDLLAATGLGASFNFTTITNPDIKTVALPSGVTASNTTGWGNHADTTWTR
ncbi:beta strand repeat-containing protein [Candidatus Bodocaedibacter vickermanii]|uniref:Uncharacterized protein n=1 Tax=Candidatus Bodocaedibacter vickermanii TaxID=2741701 RepID=A0A7L9RS01_9PROT|nr:hypothetical protein CPBP_00139 [Candidatus Paracaedibacteraceae bacterium 'Lake Konstanz']